MFLSLLSRKRPSMFMAKTCKRKVFREERGKWSELVSQQWTHPQATFRLDVHYGQYGLIQDGVAYIFTGLSVCCHLEAKAPHVWDEQSSDLQVMSNVQIKPVQGCHSLLHSSHHHSCLKFAVVSVSAPTRRKSPDVIFQFCFHSSHWVFINSVCICAFMLQRWFPCPSTTTQVICEWSVFTCRNGSLMPDTSCSGEYPDMIRFFRILTSCGTSWKTNKQNKDKREAVSQCGPFVNLHDRTSFLIYFGSIIIRWSQQMLDWQYADGIKQLGSNIISHVCLVRSNYKLYINIRLEHLTTRKRICVQVCKHSYTSAAE